MALRETLNEWTLHRTALLLALAVPAIPMAGPALLGLAEYRSVLRPSGLFAAQLVILALMITPMRRLWPGAWWLRWLERQRRAIGVAAFGYMALHVAFFVASIGRIDHIIQGMAFASMWTGWLAFALFVPLAVTSNNRSVRLLGARWKGLHRLIYVAALLVLAHWLMLVPHPWEALSWCAPLIALQAWRAMRGLRRRQ